MFCYTVCNLVRFSETPDAEIFHFSKYGFLSKSCLAGVKLSFIFILFLVGRRIIFLIEEK